MTAEITPEQPLAPDLMNNLNALAEHQQAIMDKYGEGLPYERERIVHEARFYMAQSAEAMLEAGKRLIILKENEPHGEFVNIVTSQLGLAERTTQIMMKASLKYLSPQLGGKAQTFAALGKAKLYELMLEDDEDLAELAEGGTIAGLTLDEVDRMSVRELKAKLRETRDSLEASRRLANEKDQKINELSENRLLNQHRPLGEEGIRQLREEIGLVGFDVKAILMGRFREGLEKLHSHSGDMTSHADYLAGLLNDIEFEINVLRNDFALPYHAVSEAVPDWVKADAEAEDADFQLPEHLRGTGQDSGEEGVL
nr:phage transcriptional regulator [Arsenophonus nasoniae]